MGEPPYWFESNWPFIARDNHGRYVSKDEVRGWCEENGHNYEWRDDLINPNLSFSGTMVKHDGTEVPMKATFRWAAKWICSCCGKQVGRLADVESDAPEEHARVGRERELGRIVYSGFIGESISSRDMDT